MAAVGDKLSRGSQAALLEWLRGREELDRLVRERSAQRPPPELPTLTEISTTTTEGTTS
jgi:hypothetical protein